MAKFCLSSDLRLSLMPIRGAEIQEGLLMPSDTGKIGSCAKAEVSEAACEALLRRVDMVRLVGEEMRLEKSGKYMAGNSPFSDKPTRAFFLNPATKRFHCYATDKGGDLLDFYSLIYGISRRGAYWLVRSKLQRARDISRVGRARYSDLVKLVVWQGLEIKRLSRIAIR
jgi:hypothetical protein